MQDNFTKKLKELAEIATKEGHIDEAIVLNTMINLRKDKEIGMLSDFCNLLNLLIAKFGMLKAKLEAERRAKLN